MSRTRIASLILIAHLAGCAVDAQHADDAAPVPSSPSGESTGDPAETATPEIEGIASSDGLVASEPLSAETFAPETDSADGSVAFVLWAMDPATQFVVEDFAACSLGMGMEAGSAAEGSYSAPEVIYPAACAAALPGAPVVMQGLAASSELGLTLGAKGMPRYFVPITTGDRATAGVVNVISHERLHGIQDELGVDEASGHGAIVIGTPVAGMRVELLDADGNRVDNAAVYVDALGALDLDRADAEAQGHAVFVDVAPGEYQVRFEAEGQDCQRGHIGWDGADADTLVTPLLPGLTTLVGGISCAPAAGE